jgi:hypothetical protein
MDFTVIGGALERQLAFYKGVGRVEVSLDVMSQCFTAVLLDMEGDIGGASVMLKACWCWRCGLSSWSTLLHLLQVNGASSIRYWLGLITSALTSMLTPLASYTQPFGSDGWSDAKSFCNDVGELRTVVIGWRNLIGIFTVLLEAVDKASCQCCGLHMTEVKSRHAVGQNGS